VAYYRVNFNSVNDNYNSGPRICDVIVMHPGINVCLFYFDFAKHNPYHIHSGSLGSQVFFCLEIYNKIVVLSVSVRNFTSCISVLVNMFVMLISLHL
jgi:hypothetical protein